MTQSIELTCSEVRGLFKVKFYSQLSKIEKVRISDHLAWKGDGCTCGVDLGFTPLHLLDLSATAWGFAKGLDLDESIENAIPQN